MKIRHTPSLTVRIVVAKTTGFAFGLVWLYTLPENMSDTSWLFGVGMLLWYTTMGGFIGLAGIFSVHPIIHIPMPWWLRGPAIGGWMNFVLVLLAYDMVAEVYLSLIHI